MPSDTSPKNSSSPFASWTGDHAGIRVPEFDAALRWYMEKLDFRLLQSWPMGEKTFAFVAPAADDSFRFELLAGPGGADRPPYDGLADSHNQLGWHHLCLRVENVSEAIAELKRRGVTIVSEPKDVPQIGARFAFFADPWGNLFELTQAI